MFRRKYKTIRSRLQEKRGKGNDSWALGLKNPGQFLHHMIKEKGEYFRDFRKDFPSLHVEMEGLLRDQELSFRDKFKPMFLNNLLSFVEWDEDQPAAFMEAR